MTAIIEYRVTSDVVAKDDGEAYFSDPKLNGLNRRLTAQQACDYMFVRMVRYMERAGRIKNLMDYLTSKPTAAPTGTVPMPEWLMRARTADGHVIEVSHRGVYCLGPKGGWDAPVTPELLADLSDVEQLWMP